MAKFFSRLSSALHALCVSRFAAIAPLPCLCLDGRRSGAYAPGEPAGYTFLRFDSVDRIGAQDHGNARLHPLDHPARSHRTCRLGGEFRLVDLSGCSNTYGIQKDVRDSGKKNG